MHTDKYGQIILSEDDICNLYLNDPTRHFKTIITDSDIFIPSILELENIPILKKSFDINLSVEEFDKINQNNWYMPEFYKNLDVAQFVLDKCNSEAELQRAGEELLLFQERNMFELLKYLTYLVDTMRQNKIVWGVGRGSSVSSFVLYLIGIHKINSLYYDLSIDEFLK
jgi:DNA polymerase III alpha subunit